VYQKTELGNKIRVGIVDDHAGVRLEIRKLLTTDADIVVVGEGATGADAIELAHQSKLDVLLLDVELPIMRGDEVVIRLHDNAPELKVLAISSYDDPMYIRGMIENGAVGYITKEEAPRLLIHAIHSVMNDKVKWMSTRVASQVSHISLENKSFTGRELEILRYLELGKSDDAICQLLDIEAALLNRHLTILSRKFGVTSRGALIEAAKKIISTTNSSLAKSNSN
jgi:DNA-binding NarL/FixJ family response regulator